MWCSTGQCDAVWYRRLQCGTRASGERERERVEGKEGDREGREEGREEKDAAA